MDLTNSAKNRRKMIIIDLNFQTKHARKGFWPPSAMKGIGYFQNLGNLLRNCLEIFWEFFRRNFLGGFFGKNSLGGITW